MVDAIGKADEGFRQTSFVNSENLFSFSCWGYVTRLLRSVDIVDIFEEPSNFATPPIPLMPEEIYFVLAPHSDIDING